MSIAKRLYLLIIAAALALLVVSGLGIYQMAKVFTAANFANVNTVPSLLVLNDANDELASVRIDLWQHIGLADATKKAEREKSANDHFEKVSKAFDRYEKDVAEAKDKDLLAEDRKALAAYKSVKEQILALSDAGKLDEARDFNFANQDIVGKLRAAITTHLQYNRDLGQDAAASGAATLKTSNWSAIAISLVAIIGITVMGLVLARNIVSSLREAVVIAETVASGDLTRSIVATSNDETGQLLRALKKMTDSLIGIVTEVRTGTNTITTASTEIADGNHDLSARTEQQAGALEETASSMEELTSTVKQNADNAMQANTLASTASEVAVTGGNIVSQVVDKMGAITASSRQIADIISVIDGIAFQTNILALNAAVEAARAGEQGRGFAVVATEVRNLAHRSAAAAKEIKVLIEDSVGHVTEGSRLVSDAGSVMHKVVESVARVSDVMAEITTAGHEQTAGIEQINQAVIHMDEATQQNAALVEQAAAAASSLQEQATHLARIVSVFKIDAVAAGSAAATIPPIAGKAAMAGPRPVVRAPAPARISPPSATRKVVASSHNASDWEEF